MFQGQQKNVGSKNRKKSVRSKNTRANDKNRKQYGAGTLKENDLREKQPKIKKR